MAEHFFATCNDSMGGIPLALIISARPIQPVCLAIRVSVQCCPCLRNQAGRSHTIDWLAYWTSLVACWRRKAAM